MQFRNITLKIRLSALNASSFIHLINIRYIKVSTVHYYAAAA